MPGNSEMLVSKIKTKRKTEQTDFVQNQIFKSYHTSHRFLLENDDHFRQTASREVYLQEAEQNSLEAFANFRRSRIAAIRITFREWFLG